MAHSISLKKNGKIAMVTGLASMLVATVVSITPAQAAIPEFKLLAATLSIVSRVAYEVSLSAVEDELENLVDDQPSQLQLGYEPTHLFRNVNSQSIDVLIGDLTGFAGNPLVVAFAGTEITSPNDIYTNIALTLKKPSTGELDGGLSSCNNSVDECVHYKYYQRASTAYQTTAIRTLLEQARDAGREIIITGHSMGGGIAQLLAYYLSGPALSAGYSPSNVSLYTFGAPMIGNHNLAAGYSVSGITTHRFVMYKDPIPMAPYRLPTPFGGTTSLGFGEWSDAGDWHYMNGPGGDSFFRVNLLRYQISHGIVDKNKGDIGEHSYNKYMSVTEQAALADW